jgi:D-arabinose 1-dehydrogenase-like Zn-dependent alcohol dehydrogenase
MTDKMPVARFIEAHQPLELQELPVPQPGPLDVLVRVEACGICLSDVHLMDGSIPAVTQPVTPGHEASGVVAAVGDLVTGWREGDRVSMMGGKPCGKCSNCVRGRMDECLAFEIMGFHYDGAWARYIKVPFFSLSAIPDDVTFEHAAIVADAVATPYAAITDTAKLKPGETIGLWGIGGLGTHAVQIARMVGAGFIVAIDPLESARERALSLGADVALDPAAVKVVDEIRSLTNGAGLDVAVDLVGSNRVMKQGVACLARSGRLVMVGLSLEPLTLGPGIMLGVQSQSVLGHLGYQPRHLDELLTLLEHKRLDLTASISDVIDLADINEGVKRLSEKIGDPVRILVRP